MTDTSTLVSYDNNPLGTCVLLLQRCPLLGSVMTQERLSSLVQTVDKHYPLWKVTTDVVDTCIYVAPNRPMKAAMGKDMRAQGWHETELSVLETDSMYPNLTGDNDSDCELGNCQYSFGDASWNICYYLWDTSQFHLFIPYFSDFRYIKKAWAHEHNNVDTRRSKSCLYAMMSIVYKL